ncbi:fatty acid desaturase [Legionella sp. MW5194]|uniref:acyl-CoA desaturase n=1 Tax=Legionella sp. MW5194 TaxID=2662448 RepID=UPI00193D3AF0|nr:fatty acid desaturase [Legionella sp. MW5194]QRN03967.1 fatty acid desaturase [Legionella sp. MW5194]
MLINDLVNWLKSHYSSYFPFVLGVLLFVFFYWLLCLILPPLSQGLIGFNIWAFFIFLFFTVHLSLLTISIYLHRAETHRALKFHPVITHFFRFWLWLATGTNRKEWVAIHRLHHQDPDGKKDPHSPVNISIKVLFTSGIEIYNSAKNQDIVKQLGVIRNDDFLEKHLYGKFSMAGPLLLLLLYIVFIGIWGIPLWFLQMILQIILQASVINGLGHYYGYRNFDTQDNSHNLTRFGLFIVGEELHNNHHGDSSSCKFSVKSNEWDLGWFYILTLQYLGLATLKKRTKPDNRHSGAVLHPCMTQGNQDNHRQSINTIDRNSQVD